MSLYSHPARYFSREYAEENFHIKFLESNDSDSRPTRYVKLVLSQLLSSMKLTIIQSRVIGRYVTLKSEETEGTVGMCGRLVGGGDEIIQYIDTQNGPLITRLDVEKFRDGINNAASRWVSKNRTNPRITRDDSGAYKKIFRIKFAFDHINEVYMDKYNVYQAAYINTSYVLRAFLCFVMQMVSGLALLERKDEEIERGTRTTLDVVLIVITIFYMFLNLPANYITSSMSHNVLLLYLFFKMKMYRRMAFVTMDLLINSILLSMIPVISARLLARTTTSTNIVATSLSVLFVTSLDDSAITKSESNRLQESQEKFLKDVVEKVDTFVDSDFLKLAVYLPWGEVILMTASIVFSYISIFRD